MRTSLLIVDDEHSIRKGMDLILGSKYRTLQADSGGEALKTIADDQPDIMLLDIGLPDMSGLDVLKQTKRQFPETEVIMVTAVESAKMIVQAMKDGAFDYLVKPVDRQELWVTVHNAAETKRLRDQLKVIQRPRLEKYRLDLIGESPGMVNIAETARKLVQSPETPILILGESGVGKGMLARAIHYAAGENAGPFVLVNCGAIAKDLVESELFGYTRGAFTGAGTDGKKGRFEEAAGGTLFLDEIGAMPLEAQSKLLQVLEDKIFYKVGGTRPTPLNARIIAATNLDLETAVREGRFRTDLYYRLNVVKLEIPPLRERPEDIRPLAIHFVSVYGNKMGKRVRAITTEAEELMLQYQWPGNVRELRNLIERIVLLENGETILPSHLPFSGGGVEPQRNAALDIHEIEARYNQAAAQVIRNTLRKTGGNITEAADQMGMPVHQLRYRMKKLGIRMILKEDTCGPKGSFKAK